MLPRPLRIVLVVLTMLGTLAPLASASAITTFTDDFNDGNADGWWLGHVSQTPGLDNWRAENGTLVQDAPGDAFIALVENSETSSQSLSVDVLPYQVAGYGGVVFWYQSPQDWVSVSLYPGPGVCVGQTVNRVFTQDCISHFLTQAILHSLVVDVDAASGHFTITVDGVLVTTFQATAADRSGRSGVYVGNSGASFDNFALTTVPEPASLLLLGTGMLGVIAAPRRRKQQS